MQGQSFLLLSGAPGVRQTLEFMDGLVKRSALNPDFVLFAGEVTFGVTPGDTRGEADKIYDWVAENIRYSFDPVDVEKIVDPIAMMRRHEEGKILSGDCDCMSTMMAALMAAVGIPTRFRAVKLLPNKKDYSHVYVEAYIDGKYVPYDAAQPMAVPGYSMSEVAQVGAPMLSGLKEDLEAIWSGDKELPDWWDKFKAAINAVEGGKGKLETAEKLYASYQQFDEWIKSPLTWGALAIIAIAVWIAVKNRRTRG